MKVCSVPGCPELTSSSKCEQHRLAAQRASNARRATPAARGYNAAWRRASARYLRAHPNCKRCGKPAKHAHHRDGLGPNAPHGHDPENLEALCLPCHSSETARQSPGGWNAR